MSFEEDRARLLAERIAQRVSQSTRRAESPPDGAGHVSEELAALRARLDELQEKLARIESNAAMREENRPILEAHDARQSERADIAPGGKAAPAKTATHSPWLSGVYFPATHPSQERFGVDEAAVSELVDFFESEKKCELEPGGKPCDHCAMCSSRGF